ncbi:hypothetical protein [Maioricimonas rarisocia]|uniref:hypothetical protein n=1 Tax=Maioricimonas rarisocia TaxID=2528026 RepID=UPI0011A6CBA0|nr:hypothetical protein [Maioricimonas rarisocia]
MSNRKPEPLFFRETHEACPVCGEVSYSASGIHPQCAVRQADQRRMEQIRLAAAAEVQEAPASSVPTASWQRVCPKCRQRQHVRKKVCACGHVLSAARPLRAGQGARR